jgi:hypothetical protein
MDETEIKGISNRSENAWMLPLKIVLTYARSAILFGFSHPDVGKPAPTKCDIY